MPRTTELTRGQLFAKHMKVHEQIKHLQMTKTTIAVGTPARVAKLITESESGLSGLADLNVAFQPD